MTDTFNSLILNSWVGVRFALKIQGIGDIYLDGPTPTKQTGVAWSNEASKTHNYTYREHMLDLGPGLQDIGQQITRSEGFTSPGQISITLTDNRLGYLAELFARESEDTKTVVVGANIAHDTTGAGTVITADATISGWSATGFGYLGRETFYYPSISGADFGTGGAKCTRDVFSVGECDLSYTINANANQAPRLITNKPTVFHGRYVQLFAYLVDREGRTLGDDLSEMSREIFRGIIQGPPLPDQSYSAYVINARSIDSVLHTSIGLEPVEAELTRVIGTSTQNSDGADGDFKGKGDFINAWYVTDSTRYFDLTLITSNNQHSYTIELFADGFVSDQWTMIEAFNTTATASIQSEAAFNTVSVQMKMFKKIGSKKGVFELTFKSENANHTTAGHADELFAVVNWNAAGSVAPLLGFSGVKYNRVSKFADYSDGETFTAAIISPHATKIPFFYKGSSGIDDKTPASAGFARIGDELIEYTGITTSGATLIEGLQVLTGCTRGKSGTIAKKHTVSYSADGTSTTEQVDIKFVQHFENESIFDIILKLAVSTGQSGHHGSFDTLAEHIGPKISPNHFDLHSFTAVKSALVDSHHKITWWFDTPVKLIELISDWLKPLGLFMTSRTDASGDYKISIVETLPPLQSEYQHTLTQDEIDTENPAIWHATDQIINELVINYKWSLSEGGNTDDFVCVRNTDSIADYGKKSREEWSLRGYQWSYSQAIKHAYIWAAQAFARYGKPYDMIEIETTRAGWLIRPGEVVLLTLAGPPNRDDGTRVYSTRAARVLSSAYRYHKPGGKVGATLVVIVEHAQRYASYAPSAGVNSVASTTLTLKSNEYTDAGVSTDAAHFEAGDRVMIFNKGDSQTTDERNIVSISGNNVVINSALSNVTHDAARTVMVPSAWDNGNLQDQQRDHAYISALTVVGDYSNTTSFKYV